MKKLMPTFFIAFMLVFNTINAQISYQNNSKGEVIIGNGTTLNSYPIDAYWGYSYSQSIYLKSEINQNGFISKISYYFNGTDLSNSNNWTIYLGHTTKNSFSSTTDWIPLNDLIQVYSGTFTNPTAPGWIEFNLTTPFNYNKIYNLVIAVDENKSNFDGQNDLFYCTSTTNKRSMIYSDDNTNPDPISPPTAELRESYIPNIKLMVDPPPPNDIGISAIISPASPTESGNIVPQVTVRNFGTAPQNNIAVSYKIGTNGTLVSTTIPFLDSNATVNVSFPSCNITNGVHNFIFYTNNTGDQIRYNDTMKKTITVVPKLTKAYCVTENINPSYFYLELPENIYKLVTPGGGSIIRSGAWANNKWFAAINTTNNLLTIDTVNGNNTVIGPMSVGTGNANAPNGMSYDYKTATMYAVLSTNLYIVDLYTGAMTLVGPTGISGFLINLACSLDGKLFSINITNDSLYSIDKTSGAATGIGSIGLDASFGQDMEFDHNTGKLYWGYCGDSTIQNGLYTIDTATGNATLVGLLQDNLCITGFAIPYKYNNVGVNEINPENYSFEIYPNPAKNELNITSNASFKTIKIINSIGQEIINKNVNKNIFQLNTSSLKNGIYFVQIETKNGIFIKKFIISD